jgi:hypothetical protein
MVVDLIKDGKVWLTLWLTRQLHILPSSEWARNTPY